MTGLLPFMDTYYIKETTELKVPVKIPKNEIIHIYIIPETLKQQNYISSLYCQTQMQ